MKLRIFNCHHVIPKDSIMTNLFATLVSNHHGTDSYLGDLDGVNIAQEDAFCEMRHQYYVWKNLLTQYDYVGFEHYRRLFFTDVWYDTQLIKKDEELLIFRGHFAQDSQISHLCMAESAYNAFWSMRKEFSEGDEDSLIRMISRSDIILPRPLYYQEMQKQWSTTSLPIKYWHIMMECVEQTKLAKSMCLERKHMRILTPSFANMYIMRSDLFAEYMEFCFHVITLMKAKVIETPRFWGHCTERLINIFCYMKKIHNPNIQINTMPFVFKAGEYAKPIA